MGSYGDRNRSQDIIQIEVRIHHGAAHHLLRKKVDIGNIPYVVQTHTDMIRNEICVQV